MEECQMSDLRTSAVLTADEPVALAEAPNQSARPAARPIAEAADPLVATIKGEIRTLTRGGVKDLEVIVQPEAVLLRGRCSSFYCKQLAQHAAMHWIGKARLFNEIEVW